MVNLESLRCKDCGGFISFARHCCSVLFRSLFIRVDCRVTDDSSGLVLSPPETGDIGHKLMYWSGRKRMYWRVAVRSCIGVGTKQLFVRLTKRLVPPCFNKLEVLKADRCQEKPFVARPETVRSYDWAKKVLKHLAGASKTHNGDKLKVTHHS